MRERFGLSANLALRAIARVAAHRKAAKATGGSLDNYRDGSMQDDERIFCLYGETASLTLIAGRWRIRLRSLIIREGNSLALPVSAASAARTSR
jgi:putative transposase